MKKEYKFVAKGKMLVLQAHAIAIVFECTRQRSIAASKKLSKAMVRYHIDSGSIAMQMQSDAR